MSVGDLLGWAAATFAVLSGLIGGLWFLMKPRVTEWVRMTTETHHNVTTNGGKSDPPTLPDKLARIEAGQRLLNASVDSLVSKLSDHIVTASGDSAELRRVVTRMDNVEAILSTRAEAEAAMWPAIEAVAKADPPREPNPAA